MSGAASGLRRADVLRLGMVVSTLRRGGHFAIVVAGAASWPDARALLVQGVGKERCVEYVLSSNDDVMRMFTSPETSRDGLVVLRLGETQRSASHALNLHREKLRKRPCQFVLVLDGPKAHERFAREAPDCYSVREALAFVEGRSAPLTHASDPGELERLRHEADESEDPKALLHLAFRMHELDAPDDARRALDRGISLVDANRELSLEERSILAALHLELRTHGPRERWPARVERALEVLEPVKRELAAQHIEAIAERRDAIGLDVGAARQALDLAVRASLPEAIVVKQRAVLGLAFAVRGDVRGAEEVLAAVTPSRWEEPFNKLFFEYVGAWISNAKGRWEDAERRLRDAMIASAREDQPIWFKRCAIELASLLERRGELDAAEDALGTLDSEDAGRARLRMRRTRGDEEALSGLRAPLFEGPLADRDLATTMSVARDDARTHLLAVDAGLIEPERAERLDAEMLLFVRRIMDVAPEAPPWSRIEAHILLSDHALSRDGGERRAEEAGLCALGLARGGAPELIPAAVLRVAVARLRSGDLGNVEELFEEASSAANAHHLPAEAAQLLALRAWHASRTSGDVARIVADLTGAVERTGSLLVEAAAFHLAGRGADRPDLLERSRRIYRSLPWPEREAACLEAAGRREAARGRLSAYGLRLTLLALERRAAPPPITL